MKSKTAWISLGLAIVGIGFVSASTADAEENRDGVFIHVTHGVDNPHRVLMALSMATIMCEDHDVLVYFDIKGIQAVLKDADNLTYAHFDSSKKMLAALSKQGATLMACPGCLKAAGKTKDDLAPGVQVADKKVFFSFTKGRILTLDY